MIPSTTNQLLVSEDWKKLYQSFRNADFKSYDFETLRRTMITYLRENYPEDFNDYIDSSEYTALIDLIAYLGQNLSFRIDLNARENFLETAERRDSVLRLARLINYNAKRNVPGSGFLKIVSVSTTDGVADANGLNLANQIISWNDPTNNNWYQQFTSVINSAMPGSFVFGRPYDKATISGIEHQQYRFNSANTDLPIYGFNSNINGTNMSFEIVSSLFANSSYVYEEPPLPANQFSFIYKNDNQGNGSSNTGFFVHFRQGAMSSSNFTLDTAVPNEIIGINAPDINNTDVWLWQANATGTLNTLWTKVNDLVGNNTIYNSINNKVRSIYSVLTRENDQIDLNFADGSFGDLPKGQFRLYYRQSNGLNYTIKPEQLSNISVNIPYKNKNGQSAVMTMILNLQATVSNSSGAESNAEIKTKAPQTYYVQNRMVTAEDYNIAPLTAGSDILKIKSINRISSGVSKYYELSDVSGQYSSTNIYGNDGILYKKYPDTSFEFNFINSNDILGVIKNQLTPIVASYEMRSYYLDKYPNVPTSETVFTWTQAQKSTNQSKGYFKSVAGPAAVGAFSGNSLQYITAGAMVKFVPPNGQFFKADNTLTSSADSTTSHYIWVKVISVVGDGFNNGKGLLDDGTGPIVLSSPVPTGAVSSEIIPKFQNVLSVGVQSKVVDICLSNRNVGLAFDAASRAWYIIEDSNLDLSTPFSLLFQKDVTNISKDNSWLIAFEWTGRNYKVRYRTLEYIFESERESAFFIDNTKKNYDFVNNSVVKDQIKVLSINKSPVYGSTVTNFVDLPFTSQVSTSLSVTVSVATVTNFHRNYTVSYTPATAQTGTITASVSHVPSATGVVSIENTVTNMLTSVTATSGSKFLTFSTLTSYFGAIDPCITHDDFSPKYYAFHSNIGNGYSRVLAQDGAGPVTIELEYSLTGNISSGSHIVFVPIVASATVTVTQSSAVALTTNTVWTAPLPTYSVPHSVTEVIPQVFTTVTNTGPISITTSGVFTTASTYVFNSETYNSLSIIKDYQWQIDSAIVEADGYINPNKVLVSFFDYDDNGELDDPDAFDNIVQPSSIAQETGYDNKFVYFKTLSDGMRYKLSSDTITAYPSEEEVPNTLVKTHGQLFYFYRADIDVIKSWDAANFVYVLEPDYHAYYGRTGLKFQYIHNSGQDRRLDPSKTNLIDVFLLTKSYDTDYRNWLVNRTGSEPLPPTSQSLEESFAASLEPIKSISDELVFQPTRYKVLFGDQASLSLQGTFKAVRNSSRFASDNDIKTRILTAIEEFFSIENWDFGQTFHFTELSTYVMNKLTPDITNFVVVPKSVGSFGSLYEVTCQSNEIFVNGATVNDIEVIDAITASELKAISTVVTTTGGQ